MFTPPGPPSAPPMPAVLAPSLNGGSGRWTSPRRAVFSSPLSRAVAGAHVCLGAFWLRACVACHACARGLSSQIYGGGALGAETSGRAGTGTIYVIPAAPLVAYFNTGLVSA